MLLSLSCRIVAYRYPNHRKPLPFESTHRELVEWFFLEDHSAEIIRIIRNTTTSLAYVRSQPGILYKDSRPEGVTQKQRLGVKSLQLYFQDSLLRPIRLEHVEKSLRHTDGRVQNTCVICKGSQPHATFTHKRTAQHRAYVAQVIACSAISASHSLYAGPLSHGSRDTPQPTAYLLQIPALPPPTLTITQQTSDNSTNLPRLPPRFKPLPDLWY